MAFIKVNIENRVAVLSIDRSTALNALNSELILELQSAILNLQDCVVAIITGQGRAFVAGADIASMRDMTPLQGRAFAEMGQGLIQTLEESPCVTVAAVNGFALGGGLELAMACDLIYASEKAKMGLPETNLGIVPGFGGTSSLIHRVGFHRAMEMILRGHTLSAAEAKTVGLVLDVFSEEELMPRVQQIAQALAKKGCLSLLAARRLVRSHATEGRHHQFLLERETFASLFASGEPKEGMAAFLEKREPKFSWPT